MAEKSYNVEVKPDFIERQSRSSIETAVAELIWNSLDADATKVSVDAVSNDLGLPIELVITDNGHGIPHNEAPALFRNLGGSWKHNAQRTKTKKRELHGKEGRGRFKALSIGSRIEWKIVWTENGQTKRYVIRLDENAPSKVVITDPIEVLGIHPGVTVSITNLKKDLDALDAELAKEYLTTSFAVYLMTYRDADVQVLDYSIDPNDAISGSSRYPLSTIEVDGEHYPTCLQIIEWNHRTKRAFFLATENGFPVHQLEAKIHADGDNFTSYLLSKYFPKISDTGDIVAPADRPEVKKVVEEARAKIKEHFFSKNQQDGASIIEGWKSDNIYPYVGEADDIIERAERQVFDTIAIAVNNAVPDFEESSKSQKALNFHLLKKAIEKSPEDLQIILSEVLNLPKKKQAELAELLEHSTLSDVITATSTVGDRVKFLTGLRSILFDKEHRKVVKERSQLHKILESNTWVFGEKYNLWASDKELTTVLKVHRDKLDSNVVVDDPVHIIDKTRGIVDLVLGRTNKAGAADRYDNLIIELKAPKVTLNSDHVVQIEKYAQAVSRDDRFHGVSGVVWNCWLIADSYDSYVEERINTGPNPGLRLIADGPRIKIGVKTWGEILNDNFARLHFIQERLHYEVSEIEALKAVQKEYSGLLDNIKLPDIDRYLPEDEPDDDPKMLPSPEDD